MNENQISNPVNSNDPSNSVIPAIQSQKSNQMPGAQLAVYRRAQGQSVEEIASLLKLTPRQIVALEADDYALLPGLTIVRGFIRAYAKILKVDAAPLIAMMAPEPSEPVAPIASSRPLSMPLMDLRRLPSLFINRRDHSLRWLVSSVVLLLAIVFVVHRGTDGVGHTFDSVVTKVADFNKGWISFFSSAFASSSSSSSSSVDETNPSQALQLAQAGALSSLKNDVVESENLSKDVSDVLKESPKESAKDSLESSPENSSEHPLVLKIREDSWIEIRKKHKGDVVVSRVFKAGTSETFNVDEPMFMVVGNVKGVEASLRGVPLEMKRAGNSKIARLNLK